jgi:uncharacterized protein YbjQ (UPF0145 family)
MSSPTDSGATPAPDSRIPAMPVVDVSERKDRYPVLLADAVTLRHSLGWQRRPSAEGDACFVVIKLGNWTGQKVVERFPLTQKGWAAAWSSLRRLDPGSADLVRQILARRDLEPRTARAPADTQPVLIVTTNDIPGYSITAVHGDVFGLVVRTRSTLGNLGAQFTTVAGGEVTGYTRLLTDSRNQARERMWREARERGANAVVAMRFDCNEIAGTMSEVVAYGTAVTVEAVTPPETRAAP